MFWQSDIEAYPPSRVAWGGLLHPQTIQRELYDIFQVAVMIYVLVHSPYQIAFKHEATSTELLSNLIVDSCFVSVACVLANAQIAGTHNNARVQARANTMRSSCCLNCSGIRYDTALLCILRTSALDHSGLQGFQSETPLSEKLVFHGLACGLPCRSELLLSPDCV